MKNVQNATCDGDFAPLRSQNRCVIKFRPIYMQLSQAFSGHLLQSLAILANLWQYLAIFGYILLTLAISC